LLSVALCLVASKAKAEEDVIVDNEIEAVVISASKNNDDVTDSATSSDRQSRQAFGLSNIPGLVRLNEACTTQQGLPGTCMTLNACYPKRKIFRLPAHETWAMGLYNTCKYESSQGVQVYGTCCPHNKTEAEEIGDSSLHRAQQQRAKTPCLLKKPQKAAVIGSRCTNNNAGQSHVASFTKIVGGVGAKSHEYKFIAALLAIDHKRKERQFCGGSLIDEYHVLTAAHCVIGYTEKDISMLRVRLGAHSLANGQSSVHKVDRIIRHIDFNTNTLDFDIAILTLATRAPIHNRGSNVKTICLPSGHLNYVGFECIVAGWGALQPTGFRQPDKLQKVKVKVWKNKDCDKNYKPEVPGGITGNMMCANLPDRDSCQGDSGGPLFTCGKIGGALDEESCTQIGIVSWGISCAKQRYPGVYSRVTALKDWVDRITKCY